MFKRFLGFLILMIGLSGCDLTTEPFTIQLQFFDEYTATADGCEVTFRAEAFGNGFAEWLVFTHRLDDTVLATYTGTEFWNSERIDGGEIQVSRTLAQPDAPGQYSVIMDYRARRNVQSLTFFTGCPLPPGGS